MIEFVFCLFVVQMRHPVQGAIGGWMMLGLVFQWFPLCEFSLLISPRVSSLVVQGLGVSAPTPKAQGLISGQEQRFHKWFVMALSEIKTNMQNQETKDEPQTNGSYKIIQTIIKIMEYTHIHIHPCVKSKQTNKNTVQQIDQVNKGNKKLYLPVKNITS